MKFYNSSLHQQAGGDLAPDNSAFVMLGRVVGIKHERGDLWNKNNTVDIEYLCPLTGKLQVSRGHYLWAITYAKNLERT